MIVEEEKKNEESEKSLLVDLFECCLLLNRWASSELILPCVPCILKVASVKEENEEAQKEVETALLALSCVNSFSKVPKELYLNEFKEIIEYHQEYRNLTRLAYQSAWRFLIKQLDNGKSLEEVITNELCFEEEAKRELEELTRCVDWKKKEEEIGKDEGKDVSWNEELVKLIRSIVQVFRVAKKNYEEMSIKCIELIRSAAESASVKVEDLLKGGAINAVLEKIQRQTLKKGVVHECFLFFTNVSERLKKKKKNEMEEEEEEEEFDEGDEEKEEENKEEKDRKKKEEKEEAKRKATKKEIFEKMEEQGYEDTITSFYGTIDFLKKKYHFQLSLNICDYFVNV
ncbi:uncharacterized protein MONOS_15037 [Monocercomonoides exilis]|uniref:uncharacterized protein n=1 Tax=Monocercomonoides exilis TaxID=2049356 RepID=UPI0035597068|nr:hypothetical protein MONOS_15037 [Monocercomonoides exilis]|eukprot:MONOS_15037.1-p1 / transcript=MONOS_15037.1 / gene=MONOS_15037 / organism=Monocercomonoides_exilis_PA203 / gene_product=unspecified product / transcript_product=unspecified product / location=Mono_scaffold01131:13918-15057(-) / protein_length=343 / sequence_SO=supercontig / SO=protein_coding / is_pseudo=false